jgi:hypothetical protein
MRRRDDEEDVLKGVMYCFLAMYLVSFADIVDDLGGFDDE